MDCTLCHTWLIFMPHMVDVMPHMVAVAFVVYINFINKTVSIPYDLNFMVKSIVHCVECIGSSTSTYLNNYVSHQINKQQLS